MNWALCGHTRSKKRMCKTCRMQVTLVAVKISSKRHVELINRGYRVHHIDSFTHIAFMEAPKQ